MLTPSIERKWLVYVNGLFMSGHYGYGMARKAAAKYLSGTVEIKSNV